MTLIDVQSHDLFKQLVEGLDEMWEREREMMMMMMMMMMVMEEGARGDNKLDWSG